MRTKYKSLLLWLEAGRHRYIRIVHYAIGIYIVAFTAIAALAPELYRRSVAVGDAAISVAGFAAVTWALVRHSQAMRARKDRGVGNAAEVTEEQQWLRRGYWTFATGALVSLIISMFPATLTWLLSDHHYVYRIVEGMQPNVLLLFFICMVMAVVGRVRRVYLVSESNAVELLVKNKEPEQFHRNLEQLVEIRTAELERANRMLAMTMREKAETLAEMSVLEERNRIAYEMHDVVGHTLTAAIVQLEATRRLADREGDIPPEKLELLDELVRKGLAISRINFPVSWESSSIEWETASRMLKKNSCLNQEGDVKWKKHRYRKSLENRFCFEFSPSRSRLPG